tara:strand:- start:2452 stop:2940 length:489 start_codon:yes stop_codon:yes gene_type:complete
MTEFSGRIISAEYMNAEYSLIKVRYDDDGKNAIYHLEVDPNNADFQALEADGWDAEKIIDATAESKRVQSNAWNLEVNAAAKQLVTEMKEEYAADTKQLTEKSAIYNYVAFDEDKDNLFRFKLWALETDLMKASSKSAKSKLRKSKTILEGLSVIHSVVSSS